MVFGSCACTSITNPKSVGKFPLTSCQDSPASLLRITSQCFCMNSARGRDRCMAMWWTQCPTSASGSGMPADLSPRLIARHVLPASSVRNAPAAEMAMIIRFAALGSRRIVCRHSPPAPGCQDGPETWPRSPESSCQVRPASVEQNKAASSAPAYTVSESVSEGSRCQTRLNSHGWGVPSYHLCVPGTPSYINPLLPAGSHVWPPSLERWITCPNQPLVCEAYRRFGSMGEPLTW